MNKMTKYFFIFLAGIILIGYSCDKIRKRQNQEKRALDPPTDQSSSNDNNVQTRITNEFRNFYGIAWRGTPADNLKYAKQMGYKYVFYQNGMENESLSEPINFFLESPDLNATPLNKEINLDKQYTAEEIKYYNDISCWRNVDAFPKNLATGWPRNEKQFTLVFDWQQQKVIDTFVNYTVDEVKRVSSANNNLLFAGLAWDEVNLFGNFESHVYSRNSSSSGSVLELIVKAGSILGDLSDSGLTTEEFVEDIKKVAAGTDIAATKLGELTYHPKIGPVIHYGIPIFNPHAHFAVPISYWTGNDSCVLHDGITHEYPTFSEGLIAYFKTVIKKIREINPNAKWIIEPYKPFIEWVSFVEKRDDRELIVDYMSQESPGTSFIDDERIFRKEYFSHALVGSSSPNDFSEASNRIKAAKAAVVGSWFNWYGRFGGTGEMPDYKNISEVPARLKLIRMIPNWENLSGLNLEDRHWDETVYTSPNSTISPQVIYSHQPNTKKIFVVFLSLDGAVELKDGEVVQDIFSTDGFFQESASVKELFDIGSTSIKPTAGVVLETSGYIIYLQ